MTDTGVSEHPVQQLMLDNVARFSGVPRDEIVVGTDGCGVPCFGTSVYDMAYAFARLMAPDDEHSGPVRECGGRWCERR